MQAAPLLRSSAVHHEQVGLVDEGHQDDDEAAVVALKVSLP